MACLLNAFAGVAEDANAIYSNGVIIMWRVHCSVARRCRDVAEISGVHCVC